MSWFRCHVIKLNHPNNFSGFAFSTPLALTTSSPPLSPFSFPMSFPFHSFSVSLSPFSIFLFLYFYIHPSTLLLFILLFYSPFSLHISFPSTAYTTLYSGILSSPWRLSLFSRVSSLIPLFRLSSPMPY